MAEDRKHRRSRKKSKSTDDDVDDFVEQQLRMAEKQMARAMGQMRIAGKAAKDASRVKEEADHEWADKQATSPPNTKGITINQHGTHINIQSAENIQVGSNNTMVVMNNRGGKGKKPPRRKQSTASDSEDSEDEEAIIERAAQRRRQQEQAGNQDRLEEQVLNSERLVTSQDVDLASQHIGADWRRFLRILGLEDALLSQLHQDFYVEGIRQVVSQGLMTWKRRTDKQATLGVLANTLKKCGYMDALKAFKP